VGGRQAAGERLEEVMMGVHQSRHSDEPMSIYSATYTRRRYTRAKTDDLSLIRQHPCVGELAPALIHGGEHI
jgi:hypothetical protein